jgi:hypothetical protein
MENKNYTKKNAKYRGVPCWFNPLNNEIKGKNKLYDILIDILVWFDMNVFIVDEFPIWVEVDELEK